jgi:hypothetical protein
VGSDGRWHPKHIKTLVVLVFCNLYEIWKGWGFGNIVNDMKNCVTFSSFFTQGCFYFSKMNINFRSGYENQLLSHLWMPPCKIIDLVKFIKKIETLISFHEYKIYIFKEPKVGYLKWQFL